MSDLDSINTLINPDKEDETGATVKFEKKHQEIKLKEAEKQVANLAASQGVSYINLIGFPLSPEAVSLISEDESRELKAVTFFYDGRSIRIGCLDNNDPKLIKKIEDLNKQYHTKSKLYLISENSFEYALEFYKSIPVLKKMDSGIELTEESLEKFKKEIDDFRKLNDKINDVSVSEIVILLLAAALKVGASDIHIESESNQVVIRFRIDGVLQEAASIHRDKWKKIISRMKILAKVKINVDDKPQDGRYTIFLSDGKIDVRSSFLPTAFGESVVMRLLDSKGVNLEFENLGIRKENLDILTQEISKPNGLILATGPTGAGKTTTLYAIVKKLNKAGTKIITLEDPIEYQLDGINQSQVDEGRGYTFASGLKSVLRQDPNIVMVGEIRDKETAETSVQAALTGHLVLSSLHTNDAAGVIPRLVEIGVKPYFLVPAINGIIGQRLVRKLCPECKQVHQLTEDEEEQVKKILGVISPKSKIEIPASLPTIYRAGDGCPQCSGLGYKGRIGIYEIFTMDDNLKQLTMDQAPAFKILQQAIENGMITMLQDGVLKAMSGITSLEEVYRVVGDFDYVNDLYDIVISQTIGRGVKIKPEEYEKSKELSKDLTKTADRVKDISPQEIINLVLSLAVVSEAGDIHIEPADKEVKVRFRIDGVMQDVVSISKTAYISLLSEVKLLAGFATNVKRATLDGRFSIYLPDKKIDCRLSIISGGYGDTIVIRLLSGATVALGIESLGVTGPTKRMMDQAVKQTKGIIITTGPTGSGKTTTLYAVLNKLNRPDTKIITVEDPIEYNLPGAIQTQIDLDRGYTFASAMRSLLRQNPNIMMIGEIRDQETAKIALEAAMTGHLVLSTIHANSAAGAISRFVGLGIDRSSLANAIEFSIGQRLVRRLCPNCKKIMEIDPENLKIVEKILAGIKNPEIVIPDKFTFYQAVGCDVCHKIGYKGRLGLYEGILTSPGIQKIIQQDKITDQEIEELAMNEGMVTMAQDGIIKAITGETSLDEVLRVI